MLLGCQSTLITLTVYWTEHVLTAARLICLYCLSLPGNKKDLEEIREVPFSSAQSLAAHYGMLDVLETSAKENVNIEDAFVKLAEVCNLFLSMMMI